MTQARVLVLSGNQVGQEVAFAETLIIGRSPRAGLSLKDATVSREHARIFRRDQAWLVVDLKSSNGTRVGGQPLTRAELGGGEEIQVGEVKLRFLLGSAEEPKATGSGAPAGDDLEIEWQDDSPPAPPAAPTSPAAPGPSRSTPARPASAGPAATPAAGPVIRRLGSDRPVVATPAAAGRERTGLMHEDMGQWSGALRLFVYLLLAAGFVALFYLCFKVASGN